MTALTSTSDGPDKRKDKKRTTRYRSLEERAAELDKILSKLNPSFFSPKWIYRHNRALVGWAQRELNTQNRKVNWDPIVNALSKEWQDRWSYKDSPTILKIKEVKIVSYQNQDEINDSLSPYTDKLYTLVEYENTHDKSIRKKLIVILLKLTQKGNLLAEKMLIDVLTQIVNKWIDNHIELSIYKIAAQDFQQVMQTCIYLSKEGSGDFLHYLFKSLVFKTKRLPKICSFYDFEEELKKRRKNTELV